MYRPPYWNHNAAYYGWVRRNTAHCRDILDAGCGDGSLVRCLDDGERSVTGIDVDEACIRRAMGASDSANAEFICGSFEAYEFEKKFDAVVFVASIHHMSMAEAVKKARSILKSGGVILIVGLARPSTGLDWAVEALRAVPCAVISGLRRMRTSEEIAVPVSYDFPEMREVRDMAGRLLPSSTIRYGLYYRYLLKWEA